MDSLFNLRFYRQFSRFSTKGGSPEIFWFDYFNLIVKNLIGAIADSLLLRWTKTRMLLTLTRLLCIGVERLKSSPPIDLFDRIILETLFQCAETINLACSNGSTYLLSQRNWIRRAFYLRHGAKWVVGGFKVGSGKTDNHNNPKSYRLLNIYYIYSYYCCREIYFVAQLSYFCVLPTTLLRILWRPQIL